MSLKLFCIGLLVMVLCESCYSINIPERAKNVKEAVQAATENIPILGKIVEFFKGIKDWFKEAGQKIARAAISLKDKVVNYLTSKNIINRGLKQEALKPQEKESADKNFATNPPPKPAQP